jgi:hypothetical protein
MAPTIIEANYKYASPECMLGRQMTVAAYFRKIHDQAVANNNGKSVPNANWKGILLGVFSNYPTLQSILNRLPAAATANINTIEAAFRQELFPAGEHATYQKLLQDYYERKQKVMEYPTGSGLYYPEPVITYIEAQRLLLEQLPADMRPDPALQVRHLLNGLYPTLRNAIAANAIPATLDAAIQEILQVEQNLAPPVASTAPVAPSMVTHTMPGGCGMMSPQGLPPSLWCNSRSFWLV